MYYFFNDDNTGPIMEKIHKQDTGSIRFFYMKNSTLVMKMLQSSPGRLFHMIKATCKTHESVGCITGCGKCMQFKLQETSGIHVPLQ
jgi:hypothetical protein